jgi:hypothetical protein
MNLIETEFHEAPPVSLEDRRATLSRRLDIGFGKIEEAARQGQDIARWEKAWLELLAEYEDVCDQLASRLASAAG